MGTIDSLLNPAALRSRLSGKTHTGASDEGAMLVEAMVYIAIFAILAGAIGPQMTKFIEKAAVNNVIGEVQSAVQVVEADYSLKGKLRYNKADITTSLSTANFRKSTTTTLTPSLLTSTGVADAVGTDNMGFSIKATSTELTNYTVCYVSIPVTGSDKQLVVKAGANAVCP